MITRRLKEMLSLLDVRLVDHILGGFYSVTNAIKTRQ
jgi:DNA repair protein RadC